MLATLSKKMTLICVISGVVIAPACAVLPTVALEPTNTAVRPLPITNAPVQSNIINVPNNGVQPLVVPPIMPAASQALNQRVTVALVGTNPQGGETLNPITAQTRLVSGNMLEYRGYITNQSPDRIRAMKVTLPIPANTELLSVESVSPSPAFGSTDGQKFQYLPLKSYVNGSLQPLPMGYYKALQWDIKGLGLNEVAVVKYRVRIK